MRARAGRAPAALETLSVTVPEPALEAYEAAIGSVCETVAFFFADEAARTWRIDGVRAAADPIAPALAALAMAASASGVEAELIRQPIAADGWLERTHAAFPDQAIGRRFLVRGSHSGAVAAGRIALTVDAGVAFGSGEHASTRGCLLALERVARRRKRSVMDLGTGSGILAIAAARLLRRPVLASDIEPWSVRVARENAQLNGVARLVRVVLAPGWRSGVIARRAPYDLVFANILARPLCRMARDLARHLAPGGVAILSGLLVAQAPMVLAAHRRLGLTLDQVITETGWATLIVRARPKGRAAINRD